MGEDLRDGDAAGGVEARGEVGMLLDERSRPALDGELKLNLLSWFPKVGRASSSMRQWNMEARQETKCTPTVAFDHDSR